MYLFFDTETTGLPKNWQAPLTDLENWPRMIQLAWQIYDEDDKLTGEANCIVKPEGFIIPENASRVHGITTEKAIEEGEALHNVLEDFALIIEDAKHLIAHNMSFDEKIAGAEFLRKNVSNDFFDKPKICTMKSSTKFVNIANNYGLKWPSLSELHIKLFDEDFDGAHDALADVKALARCFFELKKLGVIE